MLMLKLHDWQGKQLNYASIPQEGKANSLPASSIGSSAIQMMIFSTVTKKFLTTNNVRGTPSGSKPVIDLARQNLCRAAGSAVIVLPRALSPCASILLSLPRCNLGSALRTTLTCIPVVAPLHVSGKHENTIRNLVMQPLRFA